MIRRFGFIAVAVAAISHPDASAGAGEKGNAASFNWNSSTYSSPAGSGFSNAPVSTPLNELLITPGRQDSIAGPDPFQPKPWNPPPVQK